MTCLYQIQAQNYIPPSPDALGMAKLVNTPVNHFTGSTSVGIPLAQISGKELSIPVSLAYNASGIKVQEMAGSVGLGWNLSAGGMITRVVRGIPDDLTNGYCKANPTDFEPDLYFFSILGQSGKFVLDKFGTPHTIPYRPIIIKPGICKSGTNGTWEIIDENGVIYKFGATASARETTTSTPKTGASTNYVSSWLLTEVVSSNQTEKIQLSYISASITTISHYYDLKSCGSIVDKSSTITTNAKYVSSINLLSAANAGSISFGWTSGRKDNSGLMLTSVSTYNSASNLINKLRLEYNYFQSPGCTASECYRLKLENIYDLAPDPLFTFNYNTTVNLPSRYSKNFDHWGYYNNNTVNSWIPRILTTDPQRRFTNPFPIGVNQPYPPISYPNGAIRDPDPVKSLANILTSFSSRGGGSQTFQYESHGTVGGARIKKIIINDGLSTNTKEYVYSTQKIYNAPIYCVVASANVYHIASHSIPSIIPIEEFHVGYIIVEEITNDLYSSVFEFYDRPIVIDEAESNDPSNTTGYRWLNLSWQLGRIKSVKSYDISDNLISENIYDYNFSISPVKAIIKGQKIYGVTEVCTPISSFVFFHHYAEVSRPFLLTKHSQITYDPTSVLKKNTIITEYSYDPVTFLMNKSSKYNSETPGVKYISQLRYVTDPDYYFLASAGVDCAQQYAACQNICSQEPDSQIQFYCYQDCDTQLNACSDTPPTSASMETAALQLLRLRNQISIPIEQVTIFQSGGVSKVLNSTLSTYKLGGTNSNHILNYQTFSQTKSADLTSYTLSKCNTDGSFTKDARLRLINSFDSFDPVTGNLLQRASNVGITQNYSWSQDGTLPLSTTVSTTGMTPRQTIYTHKPMVGQTSVIDANGNTIKYEYDVFNRLSKVKDKNDHIMKQYRYHYKNETPGFRISGSKFQSTINEPLSFNVVDNFVSIGDSPTFVWDLGDGNVVDNNSTSITHTYTNPGTYELKLVGLGNKEYGSVTRTKEINIYLPLTGSLCAEGPLQVDLCGVYPPYYSTCTNTQHNQPYMPVTFTMAVSQGCTNSYTYSWQYQLVTSNHQYGFIQVNNNSPIFQFQPSIIEGYYDVVCTVTDDCGNQFVESSVVTYYKSPSCSNGGGGGGGGGGDLPVQN
jgi:hypothetical protein